MKKLFLSLIASTMCTAVVYAQDEESGMALFEKDPVSEENNLAITLSNPLAPLTTINAEIRAEVDKEYNYQIRLEPSYYVTWEDKAAFLIRTLIPMYFKNQDSDTGNNGSGLGDITVTPYYLPEFPKTFHAGIGVAFGLPAYQGLYSKWTAGPSFYAARTHQSFITYGSFVQHIWSYADAGADAPTISVTTVQPFATYIRGNGWAVTASSETRYNWANWADSKDRWIVPLSVGISKVTNMEGNFYKFSLTATYNAARPDKYQRTELWLGVTRVLR